jgi:hypothetical protein
MLIDTFSENWIEDLHARADELCPSHRIFLLIDGVFVPGLHRLIRRGAKALLFESLPGCTDETKDVSPLLVQLDSADNRLTSLLRRCNRWPMVSVIETPESLEELSERLAAWCVVEADGQRFNFRFPDTRRLPAIFRTLSAAQRVQLAGPAVRWSYVSRDGTWSELDLEPAAAMIADDPVLDERQFAILVDDSRPDELLTLFSDRGYEVYGHPSKSHSLVATALQVAVATELDSDNTVAWCEWFWRNNPLHVDSNPASMLAAWRNAAF